LSHKLFSGVLTALITPFSKNGDIDFIAFERILEFQKTSGVQGVVVLGTTGESPVLNAKESEDLVCAALNYQSENFFVYVGTGTNDTQTTIEKSLKYSRLKTNYGKTPNGLMLVTPYYNKPNQRCLIKHFSEVARAVHATPVCLYNVPSRTGICLLPQTLLTLVQENANIISIKEAAGDLNAVAQMRLLLNEQQYEHITILSGDDATYAPALLAGAQGVISVTSHLIPKVLQDILQAFYFGNTLEIQRLHLATHCLNHGLFHVPNPIGIKWLLSHFSVCHSTLRAPLYEPDLFEQQLLQNILEQLRKSHIQILN
jgi:4-hydroxy-tetrahydrodipicolinate synthase